MTRRNRNVDPTVTSAIARRPLQYSNGGGVTSARRCEPTDVRTEVSSVEEHSSLMRKAIAQRAYALWEIDAFEHGKDQEHWFQAERELTAQDVGICIEDDWITVRIGTADFLPSTLLISVAARSLLILSVRDDGAGTPDGIDRDVLRFVSLPAEVDPAQITCEMNNGDLSLKLPLMDVSAAAARPA